MGKVKQKRTRDYPTAEEERELYALPHRSYAASEIFANVLANGKYWTVNAIVKAVTTDKAGVDLAPDERPWLWPADTPAPKSKVERRGRAFQIYKEVQHELKNGRASGNLVSAPGNREVDKTWLEGKPWRKGKRVTVWRLARPYSVPLAEEMRPGDRVGRASLNRTRIRMKHLPPDIRAMFLK